MNGEDLRVASGADNQTDRPSYLSYPLICFYLATLEPSKKFSEKPQAPQLQKLVNLRLRLRYNHFIL